MIIKIKSIDGITYWLFKLPSIKQLQGWHPGSAAVGKFQWFACTKENHHIRIMIKSIDWDSVKG